MVTAAVAPRAEARAHVAAYLKGLLSPIERKNSWQLAEAVGDPTPYALQHLLGRARWDAEAVRDDLCAYVVEHLGDPAAVLAIAETGFLKKGTHSAGVQRQYSGTAGRVENCQVGVFLSYATPRGRTFLDRALYLPASWLEDRTRCERANVPADVTFATKPQLALQMIARALAAGVPAAWVVGDEVYGDDSKLRRWLEEHQQPYVLAVSSQHRIWQNFHQIKVSELLQQVPADSWHRLSAGDGAKGPRMYDWAFARFPAAKSRRWQRGILFRRSLSDPTEVEATAALGPADVLLVHEWPDGIGAPPALAKTIEEGYGVSRRPVGKEPARLLVELLSPQVVFCGHMHVRHRGELRVGPRRFPVVCLASVREGEDALAVFERTEDGQVRELVAQGPSAKRSPP